MRQVFEGVHHDAGLFQTRPARLALMDVGFEGSYPKAHFLVEEQVDFVGK
jgi:hypothetical protein